MSTGLFIGLIAGGVLIIVIGLYILYRRLTRVSYAQKTLGNTTARLERAKENKEMRMNSFMKDLQFNMVKEGYTRNFKNKQIAYISPIKFTSDNL